MTITKKDIPNLITFMRIPVFFITIYLVKIGLLELSFIIFIINEFADNIDGYLARKYNWKSVLGIFLDQNIDRFIHIGLLVFFLTSINSINVILVLLLILRDSLLVTLRIIAYAQNITLTAPYIFKIKHVMEALALGTCFLYLYGFTGYSNVINLFLTISVILGFTNFYFYLQNFKKHGK